MICLQVHNDYLMAGGETKSANIIADTIEENGVKVIRYYRSNEEFNSTSIISRLNIGMKSLYNLQTVKDIESILEKNDVDFALIHNISPLISNSIYAILRKKKIPVYKYLQNYNLLCLNGAMNHKFACGKCKKNLMMGVKNKCYKNSTLYSFQKYISNKFLDLFYRKSISGYIAISEFVKDKHVEYGFPQDKIHVLYHFVDSINSEVDYLNGEYKKYLYMGRLSEDKGILTLIKAFEKLPNLTLEIMGAGGIEKQLRDYIEEKKIKNIVFIGFKAGEEKNEAIRNARALIAPSEWDEPFGRIIIEAYQLGTPVIASDRGGMPELIRQGVTGMVFISGDVSDLINKILLIEHLDNSDYKKLREQSYTEIVSRYSKNAYLEKFNLLFD